MCGQSAFWQSRQRRNDGLIIERRLGWSIGCGDCFVATRHQFPRYIHACTQQYDNGSITARRDGHATMVCDSNTWPSHGHAMAVSIMCTHTWINLILWKMASSLKARSMCVTSAANDNTCSGDRQLRWLYASTTITCAIRVVYKQTVVDVYRMLTNDAYVHVRCDYGDDLDLPGLPEGRGNRTPHNVP